jgi:hypothetical protein
MNEETLVRLPEMGNFSKAHLISPLTNGYVLLAAVVDRRTFFGFFLESTQKRRLIRALAPLVKSIAGGGIEEATLLKAFLVPPGRGAYLKRRPDAKIAYFDLAILVRTKSVETAGRLLESENFKDILDTVKSFSREFYTMLGNNVRRIGTVDHRHQGVFLFNFFFAASDKQNLDVFDYTAGWFQDETGLDNSELMRPLMQEGAQYTLINHARWSRLTDILPSLLFKPSFSRYVLKHFEVNRTAAIPILYRLA